VVDGESKDGDHVKVIHAGYKVDREESELDKVDGRRRQLIPQVRLFSSGP